ncbi:HEAT repeat domain-containing protein [Streptomyces solicathayae]|uniref:HEAT repeat domain-containing protein n=1 Tax=Streptomyces solicathayae TaxID=3081768 RepID=A0ABZ0M0V9_9ACTN|nr:HEAT repeat domain-containing protein [Streptomyces sp. HUAS YS2]WOX25293.1 HEAT repeat domain-containing protein [Streptomyces sp. HUAS YS2]
MDGAELIAAVRDGDTEAIRRLTDAGTDPDTATEDGLPVLCTAIASYSVEVAEALTEGGADPDRPLPDGTTPLLRAIEAGSPAVFEAVQGDDLGLRLRGPAGERALATARSWYERSRTAAGERTRVPDDEYHHVDELVLDGRRVRAGHGAILTDLEWALRLLTPVDELVDRAVRCPEPDHVDWSAVAWVLSQRRSPQTRSAVVAYRRHPDPAHRRFVLDVLRFGALSGRSARNSYERENAELLADWSAEETDAGVLAAVLSVFTDHEHPAMEAVGLRHAGHPDPRVRAEVPFALCTWGSPLTPVARETLLALVRDPDARVRACACHVLGDWYDHTAEVREALLSLLRDPEVRGRAATGLAACGDGTPAVADALYALLDEEDLLLRLEVAYGLAKRNDPRTEEAYRRVGPTGPGFEDDHRLGEHFWYRERQRNASADAER